MCTSLASAAVLVGPVPTRPAHLPATAVDTDNHDAPTVRTGDDDDSTTLLDDDAIGARYEAQANAHDKLALAS